VHRGWEPGVAARGERVLLHLCKQRARQVGRAKNNPACLNLIIRALSSLLNVRWEPSTLKLL